MSILGVTLTSSQAAQINANVASSKAAGIPAMTAGSMSITLPELFLLPYLGNNARQIYKAASQAAANNVSIVRSMTDLQTFCRANAAATGVVFDCTTPVSMYATCNCCYDPKSFMPRTTEQLFPTLVVELRALGQPLVVTLAPTVLGEGFSRRTTNQALRSMPNHSTQTRSEGLTTKAKTSLIVVGVIVLLIVLIAVGVFVYFGRRKPKNAVVLAPGQLPAWAEGVQQPADGLTGDEDNDITTGG